MTLARLWPRSLIGRLALISAVFLVLAVGWLALLPLWRYATEDPLSVTRGLVAGEIYSALADTEHGLGGLEDSPLLGEVAAANERFRYYVERGGERVSFGAPPAHLDKRRQLRALLEGSADAYDRTAWSATIEDGDSTTTVTFSIDNGVEMFFELAGIEEAVATGAGVLLSNPTLLWFTSRDALIAGGGVLLIACGVLLVTARSLRTVRRAADSIDTRSTQRRLLPDTGLPTEVAALVRAINEMIDRVEAARDEQELFLVTAAHELRTPMTMLRTRLEELPESDAKTALRTDVRRMATLVDQLLHLMRIRNTHEQPGRVDLVAAARNVVADRAPLCIGRGVDIEFAAAVPSLAIRGHEALVSVAISNLVDNAISVSAPEDTLQVSVDAAGTVAVSDRGPGLPEAELERVFEPFTKNPPNREGYGLGLAIVRAVMNAHGGSASVRNHDGRDGATFLLRFAAAVA